MKKRSIFRLLLVVFLCTVAIPLGVVFGQVVWSTLNVSVEIVAGEGLLVYEDIEFTVPMTDVDFMDGPDKLIPGETYHDNIFIVNSSNRTVEVGYEIVGEIGNQGIVDILPQTSFTLEPHANAAGWVRFKVKPDAVEGLLEFQINIKGE